MTLDIIVVASTETEATDMQEESKKACSELMEALKALQDKYSFSVHPILQEQGYVLEKSAKR